MKILKKIFTFQILKIIELILSIVLAASVFLGKQSNDGDIFGFVLEGKLTFLPIILFIIIVIVGFLESLYKVYKVKMSVKLVFLFITLYFSEDELLPLLNVLYLIFGFVNIIFCIHSILSTKENNSQLKPLIFSKRHKNNVELGVFILLYSMALLFYSLRQISIFYAIIIVFPISLIFLLIYSRFTNPYIIILQQYNKDCKFSNFYNEIEKLKTENLHPDSLSFLMIVQVETMLSVDKERAFKMFNEIPIPVNVATNNMYRILEVEYYIQNDIDKAKELLNNVKNKKAKNILSFVIAASSGEIVDNIEEKIKKYNTSLVAKITNNHLLMKYYFMHEDYDKALQIANSLKDNCGELHEIEKTAQDIINYKNENSI